MAPGGEPVAGHRQASPTGELVIHLCLLNVMDAWAAVPRLAKGPPGMRLSTLGEMRFRSVRDSLELLVKTASGSDREGIRCGVRPPSLFFEIIGQ